MESIDEDLKVKKGEKFEFINEQPNNWPQWSVEQKTGDQNVDSIEPEVQDLNAYDYEQDFMYNRGISFPINIQKKQALESILMKPKKPSVFERIKQWFD